MTLGEKVRSLRAVEGELRGLGREMSQVEVARAMQREIGGACSQSYLSQIEGCSRDSSKSIPAIWSATRQGFIAISRPTCVPPRIGSTPGSARAPNNSAEI